LFLLTWLCLKPDTRAAALTKGSKERVTLRLHFASWRYWVVYWRTLSSSFLCNIFLVINKKLKNIKQKKERKKETLFIIVLYCSSSTLFTWIDRKKEKRGGEEKRQTLLM
jgi:hypothetical protein